mmetsp:Transcript_8174/g.22757  ORF Transcript_8174/g.22757 Transcript_8174/m.22757 type:complete len:917 (+) Transcript_8174:190-2940(+)
MAQKPQKQRSERHLSPAAATGGGGMGGMRRGPPQDYASNESYGGGGATSSRASSDRSQALLSASRSVQSTRSLGSGGSMSRPAPRNGPGSARPSFAAAGRGYSTRSLHDVAPPASDTASSLGGGGGGSLTFGTPSETLSRSTSVTMSDALLHRPPPAAAGGGGGPAYGEDLDDDRTALSYQTGSSAVGSSILAGFGFGGGGNSAYSVGGQSSMVSEQAQREEMLAELRQLLDAVNMSILPASIRLTALQQASDYFDHRDRTQHDLELREGAAAVLYQKLAFAIFQAGGLMDSLAGLVVDDDNEEERGTSDVVVGNKAIPAAQADHHNPDTSLYPSPKKGAFEIEFPNLDDSSTSTASASSSTFSPNRLAASTALLDESDREIALITGCLEMVHRASSANVALAWTSIGYETLPLLVKVLERPVGRIDRAAYLAKRHDPHPGAIERAVRAAVSRDLRMSVQRVTKLCAIYSLVPQAKAAMAECPGLLAALVRIIDTQKNKVDDLYEKPPRGYQQESALDSGPKSDTRSTPADDGLGLHMTEAARFNAIATLTNLAAAEPNRMTMLGEPNLIDSVARVVHNERSDVARQCAALAIMNLSNGDRENVPELAGSNFILETLLVLIRDDMAETRRNAAVSLFNLACADQNTIRLARYRDGALLEALSNLVVSDGGRDGGGDDDEARANAAETLFNMSCSEMSETTDRMADHYGLLENLALTLRSPIASIDVKMYCAATLRRFSEVIHAPKPSQGALLAALVKASGWTRTPCIAEAFLAQAEIETNRAIVAQHHGLLNGLSKLALTTNGEEADRVRQAAVTSIELLSREVSTRRLLAKNEGIVMALTRASYGTNPAAALQGSSQRGAVLGLKADRRDSDESLQRLAMQHAHGGQMPPQAMMPSSVREGRRIRVALKNLVAAM